MAHTFDIRFARSEGLAALFEAPANRLRWKGAGRLCPTRQSCARADFARILRQVSSFFAVSSAG